MYCRDSASDKDCTCIWKNDSKPQVSVDFTLLIPPSSSSFFLTFSFPNLHSSSESQITCFMEYTDPDNCPIMKYQSITVLTNTIREDQVLSTH